MTATETAMMLSCGMFEDRIQNVSQDIKERRMLPVVDQAHTTVGAESILTSGEVRIIGATTLSEYKRRLVAEPTRRSTRESSTRRSDFRPGPPAFAPTRRSIRWLETAADCK
jgi:hypothetical protein